MPKKKGKKAKKAQKKSASDEIIQMLADNKVVLILLGVIGFIFYNRSKQQEMEMLLKMKELEMQAALNQKTRGEPDDGTAGPQETKKKK